jgi:hypothetical protein
LPNPVACPTTCAATRGEIVRELLDLVKIPNHRADLPNIKGNAEVDAVLAPICRYFSTAPVTPDLAGARALLDNSSSSPSTPAPHNARHQC